jgi:cytochrome c5
VAIIGLQPEEDSFVRNRIALGLLGFALAFSVTAQDLSDRQRAEIESRIKPVGEVCLEGDNTCGGPAVAVASNSAPRSGEEVYNAACMACHSTGAAGAPKYGDAVAWADRIAKGDEALYASGINGVAGTGMMAKGGCMNCSDDETRAAVDYMVAGSQ